MTVERFTVALHFDINLASYAEDYDHATEADALTDARESFARPDILDGIKDAVARAWPAMADHAASLTAAYLPAEPVSVVITRDQLEAWAGCPLTDDQVAQIDEAIPISTVPEAIGDIAYAIGARRTTAMLAQAIIDDLPATVDLVYLDQGSRLGDADVDAVVAGTELSTAFDEWSTDAAADGARTLIDEATDNVIRRWESEDGRDYDDLRDEFRASADEDEVRDQVYARERNWFRDLVSQSGPVLLRVRTPLAEDTASEDITVTDLLSMLNLPATDDNVSAANEVIDNTSNPAVAYYLVSVDLLSVHDLPDEAESVTITNPGVWLGNPVAGSGWAAQFAGQVTVPRHELITDRAAFGYSWAEVSGSGQDAFPGTIAALPLTARNH